MALCILLQYAEQEVSTEQLVMGCVLSCSGTDCTAAAETLPSAQRQLTEVPQHIMQGYGG